VDPGPQISLTLVMSVAASVITVAGGIIQWLAKIAWNAREKVMQQNNESAKNMADESLKRLVALIERQQLLEQKSSDLSAEMRLMSAAYTRTVQDVQDMQSKMVTREIFEAKMGEQTASLKSTIEHAVRGGDRRYQSSESTPIPPRRGGPGE
jgi:hypothetical protein